MEKSGRKKGDGGRERGKGKGGGREREGEGGRGEGEREGERGGGSYSYKAIGYFSTREGTSCNCKQEQVSSQYTNV